MSETCDEYMLYKNIVEIPTDEYDDMVEVGDTTRSMCRQLCSVTYNLMCSGFLYDRRSQSCQLSAYTGEYVIRPRDSSRLAGREFYRRIRCLGQYAQRLHDVSQTSEIL